MVLKMDVVEELQKRKLFSNLSERLKGQLTTKLK